MQLQEKLNSINNKNTVEELNEMLNNAQVSISKWGQRLVSIGGYEGCVTINTFAQKYLDADPFQNPLTCSLKNRLACDDLWERIHKLYKDSDLLLTSNKIKYLVLGREMRPYCRACAGDPQAIIRQWDDDDTERSDLFIFSKRNFEKIFPDEEPKEKFLTQGKFKVFQVWRASKEMVESVLERQSSGDL